LLASACADGPPIPEEDLLLRVETDVADVQLGQAFPLTVVRVWSKDLEPQEWSDEALAPLVVRLEGATRREDDERFEETRRYRGYAFALGEISVPAPSFAAHPRGGGAERVATAEPLQLGVRGALDPEAPGPPELPGGPLSERFPWIPWSAALVLALAAAAVGLRTSRRRPTAVPSLPPPPRDNSHERALQRLRTLGGQRPERPDDIRAFHVEAAAVVRDYLEERFALGARELTSEEFVVASRVIDVLGAEHRGLVVQVFAQCDLVKFARHAPRAPDRERLLEAATRLVLETRSGAP
jgi:hypothetical protein